LIRKPRKWTRREVVLASVAGAAILVAGFFAAAWASRLVPYAAVWGNVAEWAGVCVTGLGFFLAWLTFRRQMSAHNKAESERDLQETFELRQFMDEAKEAMHEEAARVRVHPALNNYRRVDSKTLGCVLFCVIENKTGRTLTDIELRYPAITTGLGNWADGRIKAEDSTEDHLPLELPAMFPITKGAFRRSQFGICPGEDVEMALEGLSLTYRINSGPKWTRVWRDGRLQSPELTAP
jgi:hypothetical protein